MLHTQSRTSLNQRLSLSIWGLFLVLLLLLSAMGYLVMRMAVDRFVPAMAEHAVQLRASASESLFLQAEQSVRRLQEELLWRLDHADRQATLARFDSLFARSADGLWRLRPGQVDAVRAPTLYLHEPAGGLDESARLRAVVSHDLLREQGPALAPPFFSVYMDFVEDGLMVYARGVDWGSGADASATNAGYPTMIGSDPRRNPGRKGFWTPVYFDQQADTWMVSVIQPLDWQGRWVGTVGHDVSIQTVIDRSAASSDEQGTLVVMSATGDLIAHPQLRERIAAADGQLALNALGDPLLEQVHRMIAASGRDSGAGRTPDNSQWVAWSKIHGPGWYQVYLLPQSQITPWLAWGVAALFGLAMVALLPAMWLLRRRVHQLVTVRLQRITHAVDALGRGEEPGPVGMSDEDELGRLAGAFDAMAAELVQQHGLQIAHARELQREVDERSRFMTHLEEERARLLALLGAMKLGILFVNAGGQVTYCNAAFRAMWGLPADMELVGLSRRQILELAQPQFADQDEVARQLEASVRASGSPFRLEIRLADGRTVMHDTYPVRDAPGRHIGRLWVQEDVTQDRQTAAQLQYMAEHDALTGLFNRRRFEDELARMFQDEAAAMPEGLSLLFFDLDEFKYINDTFGHRAGDAVLNRVAMEIRTLLRSDRTFFRLGGDEFAVLLPDAGAEQAQALAERIVRRISQTPLVMQDQSLRLTTSLGIAQYPQHADNAQDLVAHADTAMYHAKQLGKNRCSVYRSDSDNSRLMVERLAWNDRIARALERDLLRLQFQGVYHAGSGALAHLEALVRIEDEANPGQLIMPGQFIGHAEKSGKILEIDRWVLRRGIALLARHPQLPAIAVNLSGRSFDDPELPAFIDAELRRCRVAAGRLLVELTETAAVSDMGDAARFISALRQTGCTICLDDFGTGFSSFAYLKHLKADVLKIDGMFIRDLAVERDNQVFVRAIIEVARGMGKLTVAEFVEDGKTLLMQREMGVDMVQGYYLDRPATEHEALRLALAGQAH